MSALLSNAAISIEKEARTEMQYPPAVLVGPGGWGWWNFGVYRTPPPPSPKKAPDISDIVKLTVGSIVSILLRKGPRT